MTAYDWPGPGRQKRHDDQRARRVEAQHLQRPRNQERGPGPDEYVEFLRRVMAAVRSMELDRFPNISYPRGLKQIVGPPEGGQRR